MKYFYLAFLASIFTLPLYSQKTSPQKALLFQHKLNMDLKEIKLKKKCWVQLNSEPTLIKMRIRGQIGDTIVFDNNSKYSIKEIDSIEWVNPINPFFLAAGTLIIGTNLGLFYYFKNPAGIIVAAVSLPIAFVVLNKFERLWLTNTEWNLIQQKENPTFSKIN